LIKLYQIKKNMANTRPELNNHVEDHASNDGSGGNPAESTITLPLKVSDQENRSDNTGGDKEKAGPEQELVIGELQQDQRQLRAQAQILTNEVTELNQVVGSDEAAAEADKLTRFASAMLAKADEIERAIMAVQQGAKQKGTRHRLILLHTGVLTLVETGGQEIQKAEAVVHPESTEHKREVLEHVHEEQKKPAVKNQQKKKDTPKKDAHPPEKKTAKKDAPTSAHLNDAANQTAHAQQPSPHKATASSGMWHSITHSASVVYTVKLGTKMLHAMAHPIHTIERLASMVASWFGSDDAQPATPTANVVNLAFTMGFTPINDNAAAAIQRVSLSPLLGNAAVQHPAELLTPAFTPVLSGGMMLARAS
jgi:hypothetical protein